MALDQVKRGDLITARDWTGRKLVARVKLASPCGGSLAIEFEGLLDGMLGAMAVLRDEQGTYRNLLTHAPIVLEPYTGSESPRSSSST